MKPPRVFISYSHDSSAHKEWVLKLATRLRQSGIDAVLDLWELQPGDDLPTFMERNLATSDRVIMLCTEKYVAKANAGTGGVGYEKMIVTADLMRNIDSNKVIPLIRQAGKSDVPTFLKTKLFLDFSREDLFEFSFDELVRTLHNAPLFVKPPVGEKPTFTAPPPVEQTGDPILLIMKIAVRLFESNTSSEYIQYSALVDRVKREGMSRLYFDVVINDVIKQGLLSPMGEWYLLTQRGRSYALENKLG